MFTPVLGETLVVVSDAHLGYAPPPVEAALLEFLDAVPALGDALLVNGDLFEFWFAYATALPRHAFRVAAALAALARGMPVLMVGGNHDRWGAEFWEREAGVRWHRDRLELAVGGRRGIALHGDGVTHAGPRTRLLHHLVTGRAATAVYRALPPDLGFPLVHRLSARLGAHQLSGPSVDAAAARQRAWAEELLGREPALGFVVMGHTHRAAVTEAGPGRHYVNPGAWFDGFRYALVTGSSAELRRFTPSGPAPPTPAAPR
jgi:UDP-2,3-diacylglucosamine hydrolase